MKNIKDWGFDLGGPIVKDRLWFYGTFGKQDIQLLRLSQTPDDTILDSYNFKVNWQATDHTMVSARPGGRRRSTAGFTVQTFSPPAHLIAAGPGGRIRTNRDGYSTTFKGIELTATKRLARRWMGRLAFSLNDWTEHWEEGVVPTAFLGSPTRTETDPLVPGGQVALLSGGSGKASFYSSVKWQVYANAMVQLPWGFDVSAAVFGRQGGSFPISVRATVPRDGTQNVLAVPEVDTHRYDDVWNLDTRLAKNVKFGRAALTLSAEVFNVLNSDVVLSRFRFAGTTQGRIEEVIAPRTPWLGARVRF